MLIHLFGAIFSILFIVLFALPVAAALTALRALLTGRYLNHYFVVSKKSTGVYELHHQPVLGFYFTNNRKFYRLTKEAIRCFQERFPNCTLNTSTLTQQSGSRNGTPIKMSPFVLTCSRLMTDFLLLCNLAAYRKISGKWVFAKLIREVHQNVMIRYQLIGK